MLRRFRRQHYLPGGLRLRRTLGKKAPRVKRRIADVIRHRTMELIGTRFDHIVLRAYALEFHRGTARHYLELIHSVHRYSQRNRTVIALLRNRPQRNSVHVHFIQIAVAGSHTVVFPRAPAALHAGPRKRLSRCRPHRLCRAALRQQFQPLVARTLRGPALHLPHGQRRSCSSFLGESRALPVRPSHMESF